MICLDCSKLRSAMWLSPRRKARTNSSRLSCRKVQPGNQLVMYFVFNFEELNLPD